MKKVQQVRTLSKTEIRAVISATFFSASLSKLISTVLSIIYFLPNAVRSVEMETQNLGEDLNREEMYSPIKDARYVWMK